jgi:acyl-CoA reductase-like NAD-dependent aldehyde dehydrogenase
MIQVVQAFDRTPITKLKGDDAAALERKIETTRRLNCDRASWLKPHRRLKILRKLAELMEGKREHLGRQIAREGGKPLTDALIEADRAIDGVRCAADEPRVMAGQEIPMGLTLASTNRRAFTILEPIGIVAAISAFNHPLNLIVHQVLPAIAVGCPVIVKPAEALCPGMIDLIEAGVVTNRRSKYLTIESKSLPWK